MLNLENKIQSLNQEFKKFITLFKNVFTSGLINDLKNPKENPISQETYSLIQNIKLDETNFVNHYDSFISLLNKIKNVLFINDSTPNFKTIKMDTEILGTNLAKIKDTINNLIKEFNEIRNTEELKDKTLSTSDKVFNYLQIIIAFGLLVILLITIVGYIIVFFIAFYYAVLELRERKSHNYLLALGNALLGPIYLYMYFRI